MDLFSRIVAWLSDHEAAISAVAAILAIAVILFAGLRFLLRRRDETTPEKVSSAAAEPASAEEASAPSLDPLTVPGFEGRPAIAVLPFDNLSGDPEQEYFADGIAEDLITRLSAWREFPVIARNSSFTYKGKAVDVKQVSRELGVRYLVEGSVRKAGDRVRISAQLIDATTGAHTWADHYDRNLEDVFAIQDEITTAIASAMGAELAVTEAERVARRQGQDLTSYDLFMKGRWCATRAWMEGDFKAMIAEARALYERATEVNPRFAAAFAWLAMTYVADWYSPSESPAQLLAELERTARRSVSLDSELPVAHLALSRAYQLRGELSEALSAARRAIELDPSYSWAYRQMGFFLAQMGKSEEAIAILEKGMRLSPRDPSLSEFIRAKCWAHFAARRYEEAAECAKQSIAQGRTIVGIAWLDLAASQAHLGQLEEAAAALREGENRFEWKLTIAHTRRIFPYLTPDFLERYLDGLRKAGMKE